MAYEIAPASTQNTDTPLTNFPVSEDTFDRMSDVSAELINFVVQYNTYYQSGNIDECSRILSENPDLTACFFNAEKYNQLRDSIIAMERFLLKQVSQLYDSVAQSAVGINDSPTDTEASLVAYSASKVNKLHKQRKITLSSGNWSDSFPYSQKVTVSGITSSDNIKIIGVYYPSDAAQAQVKAINKAFGYLMTNTSSTATDTDAITFLAYKKPDRTITVITEGG